MSDRSHPQSRISPSPQIEVISCPFTSVVIGLGDVRLDAVFVCVIIVGVKAVAAGALHTLVVKQDGTHTYARTHTHTHAHANTQVVSGLLVATCTVSLGMDQLFPRAHLFQW